jgi:hypothetical protein
VRWSSDAGPMVQRKPDRLLECNENARDAPVRGLDSIKQPFADKDMHEEVL